MRSYLELFFVCAASCEHIRYSKVHIDITDDVRNPDEIILEAAKTAPPGSPAVCGKQFISHSTSWRYEHGGSLYLTYLIYSEHIDFGVYKPRALFLKDMEISQSAAPDRPRPIDIREEHIVSHGMRHLSYLVRDSRNEMFDSIISNKSLLLFDKIPPGPAGIFS